MYTELKIKEPDFFSFRFEEELKEEDIARLIEALNKVVKQSTSINIYAEADRLNQKNLKLIWNQFKSKMLMHYQIISKIQKIVLLTKYAEFIKKETIIIQNIEESFFDIKDRNKAIQWLKLQTQTR